MKKNYCAWLKDFTEQLFYKTARAVQWHGQMRYLDGLRYLLNKPVAPVLTTT